MDSSNFDIGTRISCKGENGTVKFVGELPSVEGVWLGVEWDNPLRGKHDGTYNETKIFQTSHPTSGSFIRPDKAELGKSCPDAVREKYGEVQDYDLESNADLFQLPQNRGNARKIEFVGVQKLKGKFSVFNNLTAISLSGMLISGAGSPGELGNMVCNVTTLDLSANLLSAWTTVADITVQLPHLTSLNLSMNKLSIPEVSEDFQHCFESLKALNLNKMGYNWDEILSCAAMWPDIEELRLWLNEIVFLKEPPCPIFRNLKSLGLQDNCISSWEEICKLGNLSNLEALYLDNTNLSSISFSYVPPTEKTKLFPNLRTLCLIENKLSKWKDIAEMNKLSKLEELRLTGNPVMSLETLETSRQWVIARISSLKRLNRIEITREERRGAELDYLKKYRSMWVQNGAEKDQSNEFLSEHPRYFVLLEKYGAPEDESQINSTLLKNNLISVEIYSPMIPEKPPFTRKLPATMTIGKVKALIQRLFKVDVQDLKLGYRGIKDNEPEVEMNNDLRQLSFYSLADGNRICVRW